MSTTLGGLVVKLGLDAAEYVTGLTKSELQARQFAKKLERELEKGAKFAASSFVVLEGAILAAGIAIDRLVKQAANFKDLEERTGASAETLASFAVSAAVANTTVDAVATAMNKLAKNLTGVDDESKAAGAALEALGTPIKEFKALSPDKQMETLAKAFSQFADGSGKSAAAMALLGRSGAELLPFFKELAQGSGRQLLLTQQQIEQADEYADAQARTIAQVQLYAQALSIQMLPAITGVVEATKTFIEKLVGLDSAATELQRNDSIRKFAEDAALKLAFLVDVADSVVRVFNAVGISIGAAFAAATEAPRGQLARARQIIADLHSDLGKLAERPLFSTEVERAFTKQRKDEAARAAAPLPPAPQKRQVDFSGAMKKTGGADNAAREAKQILDRQLREQEDAIRREQDLLRQREHYLQAYYDDNLLGYREYFAERQRIFDEAQQNIAVAMDAQIALAREFAARPGMREQERLDAEAKLADLIDKRNAQERAGAQERFDLGRAATRAAYDYADAVAEVNAQMLELAGNSKEAARIRFTQQNRQLRARAAANDDEATQTALNAIERQVLAREDLNDATRRYGLLTQEVSLAEAKIALAAQTGATTTLEAMAQRADVARQYIGVLTAQADAAQRAAEAMAAGPEQDAALQGVRRLRLEIEQLAATAQELEDVFRHTFVDAFAEGIESVVTGTKSVSQAVRDMERSIVQSITRIAANNIAEALFGKSGPASGASGLLAGIFGGAGGWLGKLFGSGGSSLDSLIPTSGLPFLAGGGPVAANEPVVVGERGRELFVPNAAGRVVPNDELARRRAQRGHTININVTVPGGTTRASADQIAAASGLAVQRALSRIG